MHTNTQINVSIFIASLQIYSAAILYVCVCVCGGGWGALQIPENKDVCVCK